MIIDYSIKYSDYEECIINNYSGWKYECPDCEGVCFHRHGTYERYLTVIEDGNFKTVTMDILRLKCKGCKKTHSVLTNDIIPYRIYSISVFMRIFQYFFEEKVSLYVIAEKTGISYQMLQLFFLALMNALENLIELYVSLVEGAAGQIESVSTDEIIRFYIGKAPPSPQADYMDRFNTPLFMDRISSLAYELVFIASK